MEKEKKLSRKDVSLFKLNRKMESMCTRLFNLQSNIKCVKKEFSRPLKRKTTFPIRTRNIIHETQDSMPDENSPNFDIVKSVTSLDNNY
jgi:hypothetical protein